MRHDNGVWWALGAAAAAAGLAAMGRRGSRSGRPLEFAVTIRGAVTANLDLEETELVEVWWDGDPATFPTRKDVLDALVDAYAAEDVGEAGDEALREAAYNAVREYYEYEVDDTESWDVSPDNFTLRPVLGGRRVIAMKRGDGKMLGYLSPKSDW